MRTTLTLDDDVAQQLRKIARRTDRSFKQVVNEALRRGLTTSAKPLGRLPRFKVKAKACGFRPGVDLLRLNQLTDELEVEAFSEELVRDPPRR
ncbi:MAG: ribbon-helix-helix protein, CopG family [Acidobacteriota bacterium]